MRIVAYVSGGYLGNLVVVLLTRVNLLVGNLRVGNLPRRRLGCDVNHIKMFHIVEQIDLTPHE